MTAEQDAGIKTTIVNGRVHIQRANSLTGGRAQTTGVPGARQSYGRASFGQSASMGGGIGMPPLPAKPVSWRKTK